jgi:salicylate hydroxylase
VQYSDLHRILYDAAIRAGAKVIFSADVRLASPPAQGTSASVQLRDGTVLHADMIIGADGQHSTVRTSVQGKHVEEPDAPEGWIPNVPAKSLKLSDTTLDNRYGWSPQI